jgi:hypothetical protein
MIKNAKPFFLKPGWANANACHSHAGKFCISIGRIFMIDLVGNTLFFTITLVMISMILFTLEIQIANSALDVHLSGLEKHQEWKDYIERKNPDVNLH